MVIPEEIPFYYVIKNKFFEKKFLSNNVYQKPAFYEEK